MSGVCSAVGSLAPEFGPAIRWLPRRTAYSTANERESAEHTLDDAITSGDRASKRRFVMSRRRAWGVVKRGRRRRKAVDELWRSIRRQPFAVTTA